MSTGLFGVAQSYVYKIAIGVVILLVGFAIGILVKKILYRVLRELGLNKIMSKVGVTYDLEGIVSNIISGLIYLVTIVFFLNHLGLTSIVLYLIVGAILMLVILTFLVGLKDVIPNFVAWIALQRKNKLVEGHHININEITGTVEHIGFLETEIKTHNGDILYVPNRLFLRSKLKVKNQK